MRRWCYFLSLFLFSCGSASRQEKPEHDLTGNWLVVYPDHQLRGERQKKIYAAIQDSIVGLKGLKLISFLPDSRFIQTDSLVLSGRWGVVEDSVLFIRNGGEGFEHFTAGVLRIEEGKMELAETIQQDGEKMKIVWHLKKIENGTPAASLFTAMANQWRQRPSKNETDEELRERLAAMLNYYSGYFRLISAEASYFMTGRVLLPFEFYQHAMELKSVNEKGKFAQLFYSHHQLRLAHQILEQALHDCRDEFPSGKDLVIEYAVFMGQLAKAVKAL